MAAAPPPLPLPEPPSALAPLPATKSSKTETTLASQQDAAKGTKPESSSAGSQHRWHLQSSTGTYCHVGLTCSTHQPKALEEENCSSFQRAARRE